MTSQPSRTEELFCGRYAIEGEERPGGMSIVVKAYDIKSLCHVAIKRMKPNANPVRQKDSFMREHYALKSLVHPNIVKMIDVGVDDQNELYLVLEWVHENLDDLITRQGAMDWTMFYETIGRPILAALEFAQLQKIVHRDIKPKNILVGDGVTPKIADYGISKNLSAPTMLVQGNTFNFDRTPGFSPEEPSSGALQYHRDCFSFAAVAVFCLSGCKINGDEDIHVAMQEANIPQAIKSIFEKCLSKEVKDRPATAGVLLSLLDHEHQKIQQRQATRKKCPLYLRQNIVERLIKILGFADRQAVEDFILNELSEIHSVLPSDNVEPNQVILDIYGTTWKFEARLSGGKKEYLEITDAYEVQYAECALKKDRSLDLLLEFSFEKTLNPTESASHLQDIIAKTFAHEKEFIASQEQERDKELFQLWKALLKDREELETGKEKAINFTERRFKGDNIVILVTEDVINQEMVDEERMINLGRESIFGVIKDVRLDEVEFKVEFGDATKIPPKGKLLVNTVREKKALDYQNHALDSLIYDRTANNRLKGILLKPKLAKEPIAVNDYSPSNQSLDGEKIQIVQKALGEFEMLAIEGPPGTGKTKLITEIITQSIKRNPNSRILLSSQTHIALDNVLEQVVQEQPETQVLRIGRDDQQKISIKMRGHLVSEMAEKWAEKVKTKSTAALTKWADEVGVDKNAVQIGMKVESLIQVIELKSILLTELQSLEAENEQQIKDADKIKATEGNSSFEALADETQDSIAELKTELKKWKSIEADLRGDLKKLGSYGIELADNDSIDDLKEWQKVFLADDQLAIECKNRLSLHEEWVLRVGKSQDFYPLLLRGAQVVGGTCVGLASIKGGHQVLYDLCIIDEASKATPPEILIPLTRSKKWIVVGDPKQLPPFFEQIGDKLLSRYNEKEIKATVLDRLVDTKIGLPSSCQMLLKNQYRMITPIGDLISNCFYDGELNSPISSHNLNLLPSFSRAVTWYSTSKSQERFERKVKATYENLIEADIAIRLLERLQFQAMHQKRTIEVALIAGYLGQVRLLNNLVARKRSTFENLIIEINSVDAFQGRQTDVCIYSVTRSNSRGELGFLREKPRLNVALSRGKSALIIIGDHLFCKEASGENPYKAVLSEIEDNQETYLLEPFEFGEQNAN